MNHDIKNQADNVITETYQRTPIVIERGEGCTLWDTAGKAYTDFLAGIAVCNLGHAQPDVARVLSEQAARLVHVSNLYYTIPQTELAARLVEKSFADRVFFCNSGAEANEAAIKLARKYFSQRGENRSTIIAMEQSFHGRTMGTLSATGQEKIRKGFDPLLPGFSFVPFNDIEALRREISADTCAVLVEPIQGEGGVICPVPEYLPAVRKLCDETGTLLILDEIQTGMGRTGKLFAHEHFGLTPDIMTLAKALGNGLPIGAMLATEKVAVAFGPGAHASTFGGTPLICAAALEVLQQIDQPDFLARCHQAGQYFQQQLAALCERHSVVREVRGRGLLLGMELVRPGVPVVDSCRERGFLINCIQENVLRFAPPLIITTEAIDELVACLDDILAGLDQ